MGSRWADWSPVGFETDPTPGDLQLVEALVSHLDTWSGRLEVQSKAARKVLDTNLGPASWSGLAAQVFSDRLRALSAAALKAAEQHNAGAVAAKAWSMALEYAQREADRALLDAEDAVADLETAEALVATLGAEQAALSAALRALEKAYNSREKPPPGSSAPAHVDVTRARRQEQDGSEKLATARLTIRDAQERLDDAKRRAERAKQDYDAAEGAFARKLDDALHGALAPTPQPELAVVGWLGYDTPDLVSVNTPALAQDGSWRFANELDGTHATRAAHPSVPFPYVSVVAHSYGTTMATDALTHVKRTVDSFTMLGSAGIDTQVVSSLSDLHVKLAGGRPSIFTTAAELDFLAPFGSAMGGRAEPNRETLSNLGTAVARPLTGLNQPQSIGGAHSFSSEGAVLPDGEVLKQTKGHSTVGEHIDGLNPLNGIAPEGFGYLDEYTEALRNTGFTTIGLSGSVVGGMKTTR